MWNSWFTKHFSIVASVNKPRNTESVVVLRLEQRSKSKTLSGLNASNRPALYVYKRRGATNFPFLFHQTSENFFYYLSKNREQLKMSWTKKEKIFFFKFHFNISIIDDIEMNLKRNKLKKKTVKQKNRSRPCSVRH